MTTGEQIRETEARLEERLDEWIAATLLADPSLDPQDATPERLANRITTLLAENARLKARTRPALREDDPFLTAVRQTLESYCLEESDGPLELYAKMLREVNALFELLVNDQPRDHVVAQTVKIACAARAVAERCP